MIASTTMNSLSNYNILYINLDSRTERRENIESQLRARGLLNRSDLITHRISGVVGSDLSDPDYAQSLADEFGVDLEKMTPDYWLSRKNFKTMCNNKDKVIGQVGCYLAHLRAIKWAVDNGLDNVVILEDDCVILGEDDEDVEFPEPPETAEMFYLGGLFWHQTKEISEIKKTQHWLKIDPSVLKIACAFGYGFNTTRSLINVHTLLTNVWLEGKGKDKPRDWRTSGQRIRATAVDIMFVNFIQKMGEAYILSQPKMVQSDAFISDVTDVGKKTPKKPCGHAYFYKK